jgi:hypothetical protein
VPLVAHRPQNTLISSRDEGDELRRHIAAPGILEDEVEMDLEEVDEFDRPTHGKLVAGASANTTAPEPVLQPEGAGATEIEVPIDIDVAPGTTRVSLTVRLLLSLRYR